MGTCRVPGVSALPVNTEGFKACVVYPKTDQWFFWLLFVARVL